MYCTNCASEIPDGTAVCPVCGAVVEIAVSKYDLYIQEQTSNDIKVSDYLSIVSIVCGLLGFLGVLSIPGLICGILSLKKDKTNKKAKVGLALSIISFSVFLIGIVLIFISKSLK